MSAPSPSSQIVIFRVADDWFAADVFSVERVLRYKAPTAIPDVPDWIVGVLDLRRRFDLAPVAPSAETRILVFNADGEWIGAVADGVVEVTALEEGAIAEPPPIFRGLAAEYLRGLVRRADRLVIVLDVARLLSTSDKLTLDQARTAHA